MAVQNCFVDDLVRTFPSCLKCRKEELEIGILNGLPCFTINHLKHIKEDSLLTHMFSFMCIYVYIHVYVCIYLYVCMYIFIYIYTYSCIHIYIFIHPYIAIMNQNIYDPCSCSGYISKV